MTLDDLIPQVVLEAPAVPDPIAGWQLAQAARELCTFSLAWQADFQVTLTGAASYALTPSVGEVVEPLSATYSPATAGTVLLLQPTTPARLDSTVPDWRTQAGTPKWYFLPSQASVVWVPNPPSGTATLRLALQPTLTARLIDDRVGNTFAEGIIHGALYRLFRMPRREWSDLNLASVYGELFERAKSTAQVRGVDGFAKVGRAVRYGGL